MSDFLTRHNDVLAPVLAFDTEIHAVKAEGLWVTDVEGRRWADFACGTAVTNLGHNHPAVIEAAHRQLDDFVHSGCIVRYDSIVEAAERLRAITPPGIEKFSFANSGAEAVEGAMKLAKRFTGRTEIVSCYSSYHGSTQGALSLGDEHFKRNFRPLIPSIVKIHRNQLIDLEKITKNTAAVFYEPVGGESGVRPANPIYLKQLRKRCDEFGALLVFDEVQSGFGRTGTFWAFEQYEVVPDILLCAKGMGGGMPIGAFIAPQEIMSVFKDNPILGHITTFGGHPVSCAASLATLTTIFESNLLTDVERKANLFKSLLIHPKIKEVRNKGLMMAVEFDDFATLKPIIDRAISKGVITDWFLYCDNSMRIAPPLIITEEEIRQACKIILASID